MSTCRIENIDGKMFLFPLFANCTCAKGQLFPLNTICPTCKGSGKSKKDGRRKCETCHGEKRVRMPETCTRCNGSWENSQPATLYDYFDNEIFVNIEKRVLRSNRTMSWGEQNLGIGICSCVDYGRHKNASDDEIIADVNKQTLIQGIKFVREKDNRICDYVAILTGDTGYSVVAVWNDWSIRG